MIIAEIIICACIPACKREILCIKLPRGCRKYFTTDVSERETLPCILLCLCLVTARGYLIYASVMV